MRPGARDDDDWRHIAELAGEALAVSKVVLGLSTAALFADAEDDGIVGLVGTGDVDLLHGAVLTDVVAFGRASVHDSKEPALTKRLERFVDQRPRYSFTGFILRRTTWPSTKSL